MTSSELYVSVDVESSGPIPSIYSLLSIGACLVSDPDISIYLELRPDSEKHDPESLAVSGLDIERLTREGLTPSTAMSKFESWLATHTSACEKPVFVGLNAPFDWSFINYYFHKYLGRNPFGFSAIDMKAYFMGSTGCLWRDTKSSKMKALLNARTVPDHDALADARHQAELFALMLATRGSP
jgi:DNA polymerase III epsilon subunit-like protein